MPVAIPPNAILASQQSGAPLTLTAGDVVDALVLRLLADGKVRIAIANTVLDVASEVALEPGATIQLAVQSTPTGLALALIEPDSQQGAAPADRGMAVRSSAASSADPPVRPTATGTQDVELLPAAGSAARPAVLVAAVQAAAARQNSLAPLFANVAAAAKVQGLPPRVQAAITQLLALQTPAGPVKADEVKQAFSRSGLFFETRLASGVGQAAPDDLKAALVTLRQAAKIWLDTLPATGPERPSVASSAPAVNASPPAARSQATMMADGKPVSPPTGTDIGAPGLVAEPPPDVAPSGPSRNVAAAPPVRPEPSSGATLVPETPEDPESAAPALGRLARVVARAAEAVVGKLAYPVEEAHLGPDRPMPLATSLPRGPSVANAAVLPETSRNGVETAAPPAPVRPVTPPPPYAGGPTAGQPPVSASIQPDASPRELGRILLVDTDAALARQTLLQAASLPDGSDPSQRSAPPRWMFEVPLATPQGTAVAQFEIARDPRRATRSPDATPAWRARFSIDIEPLGPVHAQIVLTHARTAITLWAERPASAALLQQDAPLLARALNNAELEGGDVLVRGGEPPRAAADAGRFLDRAL